MQASLSRCRLAFPDAGWLFQIQAGLSRCRLAFPDAGWPFQMQAGLSIRRLVFPDAGWLFQIQASLSRYRLTFPNTCWSVQVQAGLSRYSLAFPGTSCPLASYIIPRYKLAYSQEMVDHRLHVLLRNKRALKSKFGFFQQLTSLSPLKALKLWH